MTDPTKRRRITPTLVQASPTATAADASDGLLARKQLAIAPVVRPADPNAVSLSGPGRRIYVDLLASNEVNWREV